MIDFINILSLYVWGSFTLFLILGLVSVRHKAPIGRKKQTDHAFVTVSIANKSVQNSLLEALEHNRKHFPDSSLTVLIDEGAELEPLLRGSYTVVAVPKNYRTDILAKGRAMHYFIEHFVQDSTWYSFIDDDNLVTDDRFLYEIPVMEKRGYVALNPVLKAREGKSRFAFLMDSIRYFDDVTVFRFFTGFLGKPVLGLHGELLTVKGRVLREIGFDRHSLTEDFAFSAELVRKEYKVWQSRTVVSIKSPNTIDDLLKQRGRWFKGIVKDVDSAPLVMKIVVGWRLSVWCLGLFGSWLFAILWLQFQYMNMILMVGGIYFWFVYLYQIKKSGYYKYSLMIPLFGIIETASFFYGLKQKKFVVINKE